MAKKYPINSLIVDDHGRHWDELTAQLENLRKEILRLLRQPCAERCGKMRFMLGELYKLSAIFGSTAIVDQKLVRKFPRAWRRKLFRRQIEYRLTACAEQLIAREAPRKVGFLWRCAVKRKARKPALKVVRQRRAARPASVAAAKGRRAA